MGDIKTIAFYLPQFHPIPENNDWWGKGFTEWTNVTKAKPLFKRHIQPFLPSDLGYYDLRIPEVRVDQAKLAKENSINAFCYWHYWFGNGKRLLDRPFNEVVESGLPDFPFCVAWANESWTGKWHGLKDKVLIDQTYPGKEDYEIHFNALERAFDDKRYFKIHGKNLFIIYRPENIPDLNIFIETWRNLAVRKNLPDFFFIGVYRKEKIIGKGIDGFIKNHPSFSYHVSHPFMLERYLYKTISIDLLRLIRFGIISGPEVYHYKDFVRYSYNNLLEINEYPVVLSNWDNTPRCGKQGLVLQGATPELYGQLLTKAINALGTRDTKLVFIKSWNEWAEGNTIEPSIIFKDEYLKTTKFILNRF